MMLAIMVIPIRDKNCVGVWWPRQQYCSRVELSDQRSAIPHFLKRSRPIPYYMINQISKTSRIPSNITRPETQSALTAFLQTYTFTKIRLNAKRGINWKLAQLSFFNKSGHKMRNRSFYMLLKTRTTSDNALRYHFVIWKDHRFW